MEWVLVALTAWTLVAVLTAPAIGRMLAHDGRPPRRAPHRLHLPRQRVAGPLR